MKKIFHGIAVLFFHRTAYTISFVISFVCLWLLACDHSAVETYDSQLNVYSVLKSDHATQKVVVDRTYKTDEPTGDLIDDALVILSSWASVDTLVYDDNAGSYRTYSVIVQPLSEYNLMVWRDDFDTVYAHTTIPGPFLILFPEHYDTVTFSDTVVLTISDRAAIYAVWFDGAPSYMFFDIPDTVDSLMTIPLADVFAGWSPGNFLCRLNIAAADSNFYHYHALQEYDPEKTGVIGGVGLFGSLWIESVDMFVGLVQEGQPLRTHVAP